MALLREGFNKKDMTYSGLRLKLGGEGSGGVQRLNPLNGLFTMAQKGFQLIRNIPTPYKRAKVLRGEGSAEVQPKMKKNR